MTLIQLKYFCEIAETHNFTAAADNLHVAQSSVSVAIRDLEAELGTPLFTRQNKKRVELSTFGEFFLPYVTESLSMLNKGVQELKDLSNPLRSRVRLGTYVSLAYYLVPYFLRDISDIISVDLNVNYAVTDMPAKLLRGDYDVTITNSADDTDSCRYRQIAIQKIHILVPNSDPLAGKTALSAADLADKKIFCVSENSLNDIYIHKLFAKQGLTPKMEYYSDWSAMIANVAMGKGVAVATRGVVDDKRMAYVDIADDDAKIDIYLSWPSNRKLAGSTKFVVEHILKTAEAVSKEDLVF